MYAVVFKETILILQERKGYLNTLNCRAYSPNFMLRERTKNITKMIKIMMIKKFN